MLQLDFFANVKENAGECIPANYSGVILSNGGGAYLMDENGNYTPFPIRDFLKITVGKVGAMTVMAMMKNIPAQALYAFFTQGVPRPFYIEPTGICYWLGTEEKVTESPFSESFFATLIQNVLKNPTELGLGADAIEEIKGALQDLTLLANAQNTGENTPIG